jgi:Protein of unknown function (DUF3099)
VSKRRRGKPPVYRITDAPRSLSDDVRSREVRYLISMGIRTVCLLLAIVVPYWPLRVVFFIGALVLPYFAVVLANAGREPTAAPTVTSMLPDEPPDELPAPRRALGEGKHTDDS